MCDHIHRLFIHYERKNIKTYLNLTKKFFDNLIYNKSIYLFKIKIHEDIIGAQNLHNVIEIIINSECILYSDIYLYHKEWIFSDNNDGFLYDVLISGIQNHLIKFLLMYKMISQNNKLREPIFINYKNTFQKHQKRLILVSH